MDELAALVRAIESQESYKLVDIIKYENGRRYIFKSPMKDGEIYIHLVFHRGKLYLEIWPRSFAMPMAVYDLRKYPAALPLAVVDLLRRA
nr:MAG: hypothetical protein TU35_05110 [Thermoproteus sp. AZ2]